MRRNSKSKAKPKRGVLGSFDLGSSSRFNHWRACMRKWCATATTPRVLGVIAVAGIVGGCANTKELVVTTPGKDVATAVATKCLKRAELPVVPIFPLDTVNLEDPATELARLTNAARLEIKLRRQYVITVGKILENCSQ